MNLLSAHDQGHTFGEQLVCEYCPITWQEFQRNPIRCEKGLKHRQETRHIHVQAAKRRDERRRAGARELEAILSEIEGLSGISGEMLRGPDGDKHSPAGEARRWFARQALSEGHGGAAIGRFLGRSHSTIQSWTRRSPEAA